MTRTTRFLLLIAILLGAYLIRLTGIESQSLWIDEGFTWNLTRYRDLLLILRQDVHPPLYFVLVDIWVDLTGTSLLAMRYFSLLASILSIAVIYQLGREIAIWRQQNPAGVIPVLAALLLALADAENFLAQEMRSYTLHVLLACLSMWGFLRWWRVAHPASNTQPIDNIHNATSGYRWLALWMLSTIALVYTFYLGAFVGVVQGIYVLLLPSRGKSYLHRERLLAVGALLICALALVPWLVYTLPEQSANLSYAQWIRLTDFGFWASDFVTSYFTHQWALMLGLVVLGVVIVRYAGDVPRLRWHWRSPALLLVLWLVVPLVLTIIINERIPLYQPRRISQIVPAIALLVAFGLGNLRRSARAFLVVVIVVYGVVSVDFWQYKQPWRQMAADTAPYMVAGVPVLFEVGGDDYAPRYHYGQQLPDSHDFVLSDTRAVLPDATTLIGLTTWRNLEPDDYARSLPPLIEQLDHLWLFYWSNDEGAMFWLDAFGFQQTATLTPDFNPNVHLFRYDRLPAEPRIRYQNGMALVAIEPHVDNTSPSDAHLVDVWWQTTNPLTDDWTTSVVLLDDAGSIVAQRDSQPTLNQNPTSTWSVGAAVYDPKLLAPPDSQPIPPGTYDLAVVVYRLEDERIIPMPTLAGETRVILGTMTLLDDK